MATAFEGIGLPPALATFNGRLYMAWKGAEFDEGIYWNSFNGTNWAPQQKVSGAATSSGVSLADFNGKLYMAWKGMHADQGIYWSSFNGTNWRRNSGSRGSPPAPDRGWLCSTTPFIWRGRVSRAIRPSGGRPLTARAGHSSSKSPGCRAASGPA